MSDASISATKKRGRPATGTGTPVQVRMPADELLEVDEWRTQQPDNPTRAAAIRRLVKKGLSHED